MSRFLGLLNQGLMILMLSLDNINKIIEFMTYKDFTEKH